MTRSPRPPLFDRRIESLPRPAVNLAQRMAQLSRQQEAVIVQVAIVNREWILYADGKSENLGKDE